jgi:hypothetical protein
MKTDARRLGKFSLAQLGALSSVYSHFQAATMDFVQLMGIDFAQAMRCGCEQPYQNLTMDGTTISCQTANLCIINPWCVPVEEKQLVHGSTFAQRILVPNARARQLLRDFARVQWSKGKRTGGVDLDELTEALCQLDLACLAEIVRAAALPVPLPDAADGPGYFSSEWASTLVKALGSDAPACTIVPPAARHLVEHLIAHSTWGPTLHHATDAITAVPLLLEPTKRMLMHDHAEEHGALDMPQGLADHYKSLLRKLLEVRP